MDAWTGQLETNKTCKSNISSNGYNGRKFRIFAYGPQKGIIWKRIFEAYFGFGWVTRRLVEAQKVLLCRDRASHC